MKGGSATRDLMKRARRTYGYADCQCPHDRIHPSTPMLRLGRRRMKVWLLAEIAEAFGAEPSDIRHAPGRTRRRRARRRAALAGWSALAAAKLAARRK